MKAFAAIALFGAVNAMDNHLAGFMKYISTHSKSYANIDDFNMRFQNWLATEQFIQETNSNSSNTFTVGHNKFSDFTAAERKNLTGLAKKSDDYVPENAGTFEPKNLLGLPAAWNWVSQGKVSPIQDQGQCGSCWAFSATASSESAVAIFNLTNTTNSTWVPKYSEQQLVSCSSAYGNNGCNGGWYFWAWDYEQTNGQVLESNYPYTSGTT